MEEVKELVVGILMIIIIVISLGVIIKYEYDYNTRNHSDDITVTEWVSPDGVHYWYQSAGYHAMLAPRYDCNGELVIDEK